MYRLHIVFIFTVLVSARFLSAQTKPVGEYQVKAAFLYNFTRFVEWTPASFKAADSPFVIGIIGNGPFGIILDDIVKGEKAGGHQIMIRRYQNVKEIKDCHILYINAESLKIKQTLSALKGRNILTVSDAANFTRWGGIIRFYTEDNKVRFEINAAAAKTAKLRISSKLLNLARIY